MTDGQPERESPGPGRKSRMVKRKDVVTHLGLVPRPSDYANSGIGLAMLSVDRGT